MKTSSSFLLFAALSPAALLFTACSKNDTAASVAKDAKAVATDIAADTKEAAVASWDSIKDFTFDRRDDFATGFDHMMTASESGMAKMNAKLKGMPQATANARDVAVKEFNEASAACKVQLVAVRASTADTWAATKVKADAAWQRMQKAYDALSTPAAS